MNDFLNNYSLEFEKPVLELENQIKELREIAKRPDVDISKELRALEKKALGLLQEIYANLDPWERVQLSRHPLRPHARDYIKLIFSDFKEISGDRRFANDAAIITGFGMLGKQRVAIIGIEKGRKTKEKVEHNFGMPRPEGYRKALRLMKLAGQFNIPIISFVDTPGAYPGIGAEERGQSQAIADNLAEMFDIPAPIVAIIIGEGGSGGALGVAVADRVLMMEYSVYSVISPESCASILWADAKMAKVAANALKLVPEKAQELGVIDGIITEPMGGAHRDLKQSTRIIKRTIEEELASLLSLPKDQLLDKRYQKFRKMGNSSLVGALEDN